MFNINLSDQIEYRKVSGSASTASQSFYSNKNINLKSGSTTFDSIDSPLYYSYGGTKNYYGQEPQSVFTNLNIPFIRFYFTANTHSISGDTEFVHQIYKLNNDIYSKFNMSFSKINSINSNEINTIRKKQIVTQNGKSVTTEIVESSTNSNAIDSSINTGTTTIEDIKNFLENPYYEIVVPSSAMTFPIYDLLIPQYIKTTGTTAGEYRKEMFEDKSQYFVKSFFRFKIQNDPYEIDVYKIYNNNDIDDFNSTVEFDSEFYPSYFNNLTEESFNQKATSTYTISTYPTLSATTYEDKTKDVSITSTTFSGTVVGGNFFSYFNVPNKPKFELPILSGETNTFTPRLYTSNIEDGDEYIIEVTYDLNDSGFTNNKVVYNFPKNLNSETKIQESAFSMKTNSNFMYRFGNVKKIKNVFDVNQKVITFSESLTGSTQVNPPQLYIFTEIDSPGSSEIAILENPPSVLNQESGNYELILGVSGSTVTGATINIVSPIGEVLTGITNSIGNISFSGLQSGTYTITTEYRGYDTHIQQVYLGSNKEIGYTIEILWDNEFDTWGSKENDIILF